MTSTKTWKPPPPNAAHKPDTTLPPSRTPPSSDTPYESSCAGTDTWSRPSPSPPHPNKARINPVSAPAPSCAWVVEGTGRRGGVFRAVALLDWRVRAWCEGTEAYLYRSEGALGASMGSLGLNGVWLRVWDARRARWREDILVQEMFILKRHWRSERRRPLGGGPRDSSLATLLSPSAPRWRSSW